MFIQTSWRCGLVVLDGGIASRVCGVGSTSMAAEVGECEWEDEDWGEGGKDDEDEE